MKMISIFLAGITGLKPEDFFEPKSHKGFYAKCIENAYAKLNSNEKRWTRTPKEERDKARQTLVLTTAALSNSPSTNSLITTVLLFYKIMSSFSKVAVKDWRSVNSVKV